MAFTRRYRKKSAYGIQRSPELYSNPFHQVSSNGHTLATVERGKVVFVAIGNQTINLVLSSELLNQLNPNHKTVIKEKFHKLVNEWRRATRHISSVNKTAMHPAYQQIIGMGQSVLPLILEDLKQTRGHWLWALFAITGTDPAHEGATFDEAVDAWLKWGAQQGYLANA